ncbi:MAG: glycoside hydrolase family 2 protein [Lachnospiraceae bacterium]|nr:glycoside hydrolase family 2 protein [Lachnospiraceae bacterium]
MKRIDINQDWKMRIVKDTDDNGFIPAEVPGSVYSDLMNAGLMEDPYWRDNETDALKLMENDFLYAGTIDVNAEETEDADEVLLRFNGLDTLADIELNGKKLGSTNNMHRIWEYPVKDILKEDGNELKILFHSPVKYIAEQFKEDPAILGTEDAMRGFPKLRKGHYMFGWDWGPRLPDAGIWKEIELLKVKKARLTRVYIHQAFNEGMTEAGLSFDISSDPASASASEELKALITVISPGGRELYHKTEVSFTNGNAAVRGRGPVSATGPASGSIEEGAKSRTLRIEEPELWWPNGLGDQPLYTVITELADGAGNVCDSVRKRIGLRRMEVSTAKDEYGSEFAHVINNVKFFAMGADYIPEDNILSRTDRDRTYELLRQCVAANFNCIRVWGGGLYPSDGFYDACDELGLVVWQDFMFACANYRLTRGFEDNILAELRDNVRRLSHHASLGLWCGNNEMEMFVLKGEWGARNEIKSDYVKMYEYLFPRLLEEEDPDRFYWPASPSSGGGFDEPNSPDRGDVHYWEVWHGSKPFTEYRKYYFRYLSEFGFQSFPSIKTIESFTEPSDRNVFSYIMEKHQRNAAANGKIMDYMEQTFLYPNDLDTLIYASQLLQAEAIRYGVEHFRRNRGRCMGTVYWQLNDCWPVASWSSIDYFGRWKALHYYAKRFYSPFMISCEEEGLLTQSLNVNAEPFEVEKSIRLSVSNESLSERSAAVSWQLRDNTGAVIRSEEEKINVGKLSSIWMDKVELPEAGLYDNYVSYQLTEGDEVVSEGTVLFCPPKHFRFEDPELSVRAEKDEIIVTAQRFAKSIEIRNADDDLILSDNFFDMSGGERRVRIIKGEPKGLMVRSVYDIR